MIRTTQTTSFQRVLTSLESDADALESLADSLRVWIRDKADKYRSDTCQDFLNALEDMASDTMVEAEDMRLTAGQDALDTAAEVGSWE